MSEKAATLVQSFHTNQWIIREQTKGLTHADSLLALPFRGNRMNWVLGHLAQNRDSVLRALGEAPLLTAEDLEIYRRGSDVLADSVALSLERLLEILETSLSQIVAVLEEMPAEQLAKIIDEEKQSTLEDRIRGLHWHETYHLGQLELLRQLAGTNDAIIP